MSYIDDFRAASPLKQGMLAAAALAVLLAVGLVVYFAAVRVPYAVLFSNLRPADAAAIVQDLDKKKIAYRLRDSGATVLVPEPLVDSTRLAVMGEDLPIKGAVGFELFNKSDMGLTEFAQRINYQRALQGELARTIMTMEGVDVARVHLSLPEPSVFRDDHRPPKASATVTMRPGRALTSAAVAGIRRLIAAAVTDLDLSDVVILDGQGNILSGDAPSRTASPMSADIQQQRSVESFYTARIRRALVSRYPDADVQASIPASADSTAVDQWSPASRSFPLAISILADAKTGSDATGEIRTLALAALGPGGEEPDTVTVAARPEAPGPVEPIPTRQAPMAAARAASASGALSSSLWIELLVGALIPLGFLAGLLARRRKPPRTLSEQKRLHYADQLRNLLSEHRADASQHF